MMRQLRASHSGSSMNAEPGPLCNCGIVYVSQAELEAEWLANGMPAKLAGTLTHTIVDYGPATNKRFRGGESRIVILRTPNGRHIGTMHEVQMGNGQIVHRHPKDY